jgi:hypothetical protein
VIAVMKGAVSAAAGLAKHASSKHFGQRPCAAWADGSGLHLGQCLSFTDGS